MSLRKQIEQIGLTLPPQPAAPAGDYVRLVEHLGLIEVSGQIPVGDDGKLLAAGKVGAEVDLETAQRCAERCVLNALGAVDAALGLTFGRRFERAVKLRVYVASDPGFTRQHVVADAASGLLVRALGDRGRHARAAVGCVSLPLDAPVEVELTLGLRSLGDDHGGAD
ncbi:MAG: RidA family protein [Planctomycetota bacterium]